MNNIKLKDLNEKFTRYFNGKDGTREKALKLSRTISKRSSAIIRKLHSHSTSNLSELLHELQELKKEYKKLKAILSTYPELYHSNLVENNIQEYAEAIIMLTLIKNNLKITKLPDPDKLDMPYSTYLLGLSDVIGEFRRCTLEALLKKDISEARKYLETMEQLYEIIINLNYPDKVLPLRRKQDIARALIEKTRSELAFAMSEYDLVENISELKSGLNSYYKKIVRKN